jgi:branched-subunit amino acid transport protein
MTSTVDFSLPALLAIVGLALVTLGTRGFFLFPRRAWPLPDALKKGLRYAPLAALVAVAAPEVVMSQGELIGSWQDARPPAALAGALYYAWRRGILGTIVVGMGVLLSLKLGLGW